VFVNFVQKSIVPALQDFIAGLSGGSPKSVKNALRDAKGRVEEFNDGLDNAIGTQGSGAFGLGVSVKNLAGELGRLNSALLGTSSAEGGLGQLISGLTKLVELINTLIAPFTRLVELSRAFSESQQNVRLTVPEFISKPSAAVGNAVNNVVVNVTGAIDPQGVARTVTKVLGTASKTTGVKVPASALRVPL